jgi:hypothetical protein
MWHRLFVLSHERSDKRLWPFGSRSGARTPARGQKNTAGSRFEGEPAVEVRSGGSGGGRPDLLVVSQ